MNEIVEQINKLKYHQRLLLTISMDEEPEQYSFFHMIINHDLSEKDTKIIVGLLQTLEEKRVNNTISDKHEKSILALLEKDFSVTLDTFQNALNKANLDLDPVHLLKALKRQHICIELCDYLLNDSNK
ncbi:DUF1878 family protein [Rossellomorea sp. NPDC077527]|uniref:DUF1878 family protein n=1 Tax=Rossellomorea sp. NPDC077527 TaxID=3364510 RepID=UPI0037C63869